jgi:Zn-dependent M16 (insulinase) family peptidase
MVPCASIESSFFRMTAPSGLTSYEHPDYAAVLMAIEVFITLEGPFWRKIRGKG